MLTTNTLTWALALLSTASASTLATKPTALAARQSGPDCSDVHIFLAKGWNEPYPGRQGKLAGAICYGLPSCDYEDILFDNAEGTDYCKAVTQGKRNGLKAMKAYAARCPNAKLVLTGYSQGANVVGDMLGGGSGKFGDCFIQPSTALDPATSPGKQSESFRCEGFGAVANLIPSNSRCRAPLRRREARGQPTLQLPEWISLLEYEPALCSFPGTHEPVRGCHAVLLPVDRRRLRWSGTWSLLRGGPSQLLRSVL